MPSSPASLKSSQLTEICPQCKSEMPVFHDEPKWCAACEWNLIPTSSPHESTYGKLYKQLGKKAGEQLFTELVNGKVPGPRRTFSKSLAYVLATIIHLATFMMITLTVGLFFVLPLPVACIMAVFLSAFAWVLRPRLFQFPKETLSRKTHPKTYALVDRVTEELKTTRFHSVVIIPNFNAFYYETGFGPYKKKILSLGMPLLAVLEPDDIVALIAHEASHGINGDSTRGVYIGSALSALAGWYFMLCPTSEYEGQTEGVSFPVLIGNVTGAVLALIPWCGHYLLAHLLLRQSQECEYLADQLASQAAGTESMKSLLSKFRILAPAHKYIERAAQTKASLFDLLKQDVPTLSPHEIERQRRIEEREGLSLDTTHPPTEYRIKYLDAIPPVLPRVKATTAEVELIFNELADEKRRIQTQLIDDYLDTVT